MTSLPCHDGIMDLTPYIDGLQRDLLASAAPGGADVTRAAELLGSSIEASARLCLLEALSDAAAEITARLHTATVDVRLRGREADLTVTEIDDTSEAAEAPVTPPPMADTGDLARVTLRIPEPLKEQVERAAALEGVSVNAWLVRAIAGAIGGRGPTPPMPPTPPGGSRRGPGRRLTGYAQT
jgi:HicB family